MLSELILFLIVAFLALDITLLFLLLSWVREQTGMTRDVDDLILQYKKDINQEWDRDEIKRLRAKIQLLEEKR